MISVDEVLAYFAIGFDAVALLLGLYVILSYKKK